MTPAAIKRLFNYTTKDPVTGCWVFTSSICRRGYGHIRDGGKVRLAHRVSWEAFKGEALEPKQLLCHSCDNPSCVNPDHLFIGSHLDNSQDAVSKGRMGKLSSQQVEDIRQAMADGVLQKALAAEYGVSTALVSYIKNGLRRKP